MRTLFALSPALDTAAIAAALKAQGRVQVQGALTADSAEAIHEVLSRGTDWGLAWAAAGQGGKHVRGAELRAMDPQVRAKFGHEAATAARQGQFAFLYAQYPMIRAYNERWQPGHPLDLLLEHLNSPAMLDFARAVSGDASIVNADAQATLYAPGHFLTQHDDLVREEGRRLAYVFNFARDWRPDYGGQLNFLDADGNTALGLLPRFNTLNLFTVPMAHCVAMVSRFAPVGRFSITGWFRDH